MKCNTPIDPETKMALEGEALEVALKDPSSPRCGQELSADDVFCPSCGAKVEQSVLSDSTPDLPASNPKPHATSLGNVLGILFSICGALIIVLYRVNHMNRQRKTDMIKDIVSRRIQSLNSPDNLGVVYNNGESVSEDKRESFKRCRKAAKKGDADAQFNLGLMYANGRGVAKDEAEAVKWFRKAAEQGYAAAQFNLGVAYDNGRGVARDGLTIYPVKVYKAGAIIRPAQFNLGLMYESGCGVAKDDAEAVKWFRKAAEQELAAAQKNLGAMYESGRGVAKDEAEAVKWFRKAAEQGDAGAQKNLGVMYESGRGVAKDEAEAVKWFRKAAEQGDERAIAALLELTAEQKDGSGKMVAEQRSESKGSEEVRQLRKAAEQGYAVAHDISIDDLYLTMKWCPPGKFMMGSLETEDGRFPDESQHSVTIHRGFWIGETEVTQGQWKRLMGETIVDLAARTAKYRQKKEDVKKLYDEPNDDVPVYNVCWNDAAEFCRKLAAKEKAAGRIPEGYEYRLPSEEEWEYACRAGAKTALPNNKDIHIIGEYNAPELDEIAWYGGNSSVGFSARGWDVAYITGKQHPGQRAAPRVVKGKKPNAWGLYDMLGNVSEWCLDRMEKGRAMRGGSWSNKARLCRPARRAWNAPNWRGNYIGFRVVLAPIAEKSSTATGEVESTDRKAAEQGDAAAQDRLGYRYTMGNGVAKDDKEAVKWYRKAAEQGHAPAQNSLGYCYAIGSGVAKDDKEAARWFRKSAEQGNVHAQNSLGFSYLKGNGVEKNVVEAVKWFRKAAERGYAKAQCQLGFCYARGEGVTKDTDESLKWFRKAAEQGDGAACCEIGEIYRRGLGRQKDANKATEWYRKGAAVGDSGCITSLGFRYFYGNSDSTPKDHKKALELFQKAIEIDRRPWAYDGAGLVYYYGETGKPDYGKAVEMFRKASSMGVYEADYYLGICYKTGRGVAKDQVEAMKWFRKAAERGYAKAQCQLGFCYAKGEGVAKDAKESLKWFRKAAEQGDGPACYEMGEVYRKGVGTKKDMNKAVEWYRKGVALGHSGCIMSLGFRYFYGESDLTPNNPKIALELFQKSIKIDDRPWAYYGAGLVYFHGIDGKPDYEKAVEMLKKASDRGVVCANYNLGVCYENGNGVEKDINKAKALYEKAAKGFDPAKKALERLNRNKQ